MLKQDPENDGDAISKSYVNTVIKKKNNLNQVITQISLLI